MSEAMGVHDATYLAAWFSLFWAWSHAAIMWAAVHEGSRWTAWYGAAAFVLFSLVSALCFVGQP